MISAEKRFELHELMKELAKDLCLEAKRMADGGRYGVDFKVCIEKSSYSDSPVIKYYIGEYPSVSGSDLKAAVEEHYRRKGWDQRNEPMVLLEAPQPAPEE